MGMFANIFLAKYAIRLWVRKRTSNKSCYWQTKLQLQYFVYRKKRFLKINGSSKKHVDVICEIFIFDHRIIKYVLTKNCVLL